MPNIKGISNSKGDIVITKADDKTVSLLRTDLLKFVENVDLGLASKTEIDYDVYTHCYEDLTMKNPKRTAVLVCKKGYLPFKEWWRGDSVVFDKWSGIGMCVCPTSDNVNALSNFFSAQMANLVAAKFTDVRMTCCNWNSIGSINRGKAAVALAVAMGLNVIWGVSGSGNVMTLFNWKAYSDKVLELAAWAESNGVYEFQIGNEEESFNDNTTLTDTKLRENLRTLAIAVKAIFKRGKVSYSCQFDDFAVDPWIDEGKGDIDLLAINCYRGGLNFDNRWKTSITNMVNTFGVDGTYITEFNLSGHGLSYWSTDEAEQASGLAEMIDYIKASGVKRAMYFAYYDDMRPAGPVGFGALKTDKTYRKLWNILRGING